MRLLQHIETCASTNDEIIHFINYKNSNIVGIYTFNQTQGRGQYGNSWTAIPNKNLAYSIAIPTSEVTLPDSLFNYCTAIVVRDFLAKVTEINVEIKWPNDIIINQKKVCGILIEKKNIENSAYFIIGIGINILNDDFGNISNAGSLRTQTGRNFNIYKFPENLHRYLIDHILTLEKEKIIPAINKHLFRKDKISVFEIDKVRQNGIIRNVNENGKILIELESGVYQEFYHKQVQLLY